VEISSLPISIIFYLSYQKAAVIVNICRENAQVERKKRRLLAPKMIVSIGRICYNRDKP